MTDVEDLLTRTLKDPARALPVPADPVGTIRRRAAVQRRNTAVGVAVVVLVVAATLLVPVTVARLTRPAPVATDPAPAGSGFLDWPVSGPLAGDGRLVRDAAARWRSGSTRLLWAGRVGAARVVLLQGPGADGRPALAEVADRDGRLTLLGVQPVADPGISAVRLVDPAAPGTAARTLVLPRPGSAAVTVVIGSGATQPVPAGGVVDLPGELAGRPAAVLDRDGRVLGDGELPAAGRLAVVRGDVRLTSPRWDSGGIRPPRPEDYSDGRVLGGLLDPGWTEPVEVGVIEGASTLDVRPGRTAEPRLYEVHRAGRTYLGWIVWVGAEPHCAHLDDVTDSGGQPDALVLRCPLPEDRAGIVYVDLHDGIRMRGLRIDAGAPGQRPIVEDYPRPLDGGSLIALDALPTGGGLVRLEDVSGQRRPDLRLSPYRP